MAVNDTYVPMRANPFSGQTEVTIPWFFYAATDLIVSELNVLQVLDVDYTVTLPTDPITPNGKIDFTVGLPAGNIVLIQRSTPLLQQVDFAVNGPLPAEAFEEGLDRGMMIAQELMVGRTAFLAAGDSSPDVFGASFAIAPNVTSTITTFDNGRIGQLLTVLLTGPNVDFTHGSGLRLAGGVNWTGGVANDVIQFTFAGSNWFEVSRSVNS